MIKNFIIFISIGLFAVWFTACDAWDEGEHPQLTAVKKIAEYADSNDTENAPDFKLYEEAGVEIDASDVNATNSYIKTLGYSDVDTTEEIQAIVDNLDAYTNVRPTAKINAESTSVVVGETIFLDAIESSDSDGAIVSYQWKIGSTIVGNGISYDAKLALGRYIVDLIVTDEYNATDTDSISIIFRDPDDNTTDPVETNEAPKAIIEEVLDDNNVTTALESISTDDKEVVKIEWKEGTTVLATNVNPYSLAGLDAGDHTITLLVEDREGLTSTATITVNIE